MQVRICSISTTTNDVFYGTSLLFTRSNVKRRPTISYLLLRYSWYQTWNSSVLSSNPRSRNAPYSFYYSRWFALYCQLYRTTRRNRKVAIDLLSTYAGYFFRRCSSKLGNIGDKSFFSISTICVLMSSLLIASSSKHLDHGATERRSLFYRREKSKR